MGRVDSEAPGGADQDTDRRVAARHFTCFPAAIESPDQAEKSLTSVIWDLSVTGTLLVTNARLSIGDPVSLKLYLSMEKPVQASGKVVRFEPSVDPHSTWAYRAAIKFDTALTAHENEIRALEARQVELGLHKR